MNGTTAQRAPFLNGAAGLLVAVVWLSTVFFGVYIAAYYGGAIPAGTPEDWNLVLPDLHRPGGLAGNAGMGLHFLAGAILLVVGPLQLLGGVRRAVPAFHRAVGWLYILSALGTAVGGLVFIVARGTVGGPVMSAGFGLYGLLMGLCAVMTLRHARARRIGAHRAWAIRLFALAIGSWLYRMEYGFWFMATDGAGHTEDFRGWFDVLMAFFFYVPNLVVAEFFIRGARLPAAHPVRIAAGGVMLGAAGVVALGTFYFVKILWLPETLKRLAGA